MKTNFRDKKGRNIVINIDDDEITAIYKNIIIAQFCYSVIEMDYNYIYELYSMNVNSLYHKSGIGTEIIRQGENHFVNVIYPHDTGDKNTNHLSIEGAALIQSCIGKGIISSEKYYGCYEDDSEY